MCGIFGVVSKTGPVSKEQLSLGIASLRHRGPDGEGVWISNDLRFGLAHCRLKVTGGSNGRQPIVNSSNMVAISVNGEFYGYQEIRKELTKRGYHFSTNSDSEIALHLYDLYGLDFVKHLRGEFALVLVDQNNGRLVAARDRFGIKPLVYWDQPDKLLIASEAKAFASAVNQLKWDEAALWNSFRFQYTLPSQTLFQDIKQVPPGCMLISENRKLSVQRYWSLPNNPPEIDREAGNSERKLVSLCREKVVSSVLDRVRSDSPVCFHLSGGLDSSANFGVATKELDQVFDAFCVKFSDSQYDESGVAKSTVKEFGGRLNLVSVDSEEIQTNFKNAVKFSEGLSINGHHVSKLLLHKAIKEAGYKVVISGEGADEAFFGYGHLRLDYDSVQEQDLLRSNQTSVGIMLPSGEQLDLREIQKKMGFVPTFLKAKASMGFRIHQLLGENFVNRWAKVDPYWELASIAGRKAQGTAINQSAALWIRTALANYILRTLGDGTEMAWSVEGRVPFLDHDLFEFAWNLPTSWKIRDGQEKYLLRKAVEPFVTKQVYRKQKHPFASPPLGFGDQESSYRWLQEIVSDESFRNQPFFDRDKVLLFLKDWKKMDRNDQRLWDPVLFFMLSVYFIQQELIR